MHNLGTYIRKIDVALRAVIYISISKTQAYQQCLLADEGCEGE